MKLRGKAHKYGANVNTDAIIPTRHLVTSDPTELAKHCMEAIDSDFRSRLRAGDVIVATTNFGSGSSREHAPLALKGSGIACVVAYSFARIFFRNAINIGLPVVECPGAAEITQTGDEMEVDFATGEVSNLTQDKVFQANPYPELVLQIIAKGGLIEYLKEQLASKKTE